MLTLFVAPSFSQKKDTYRVRTVVIDPGHGGAKPGAIGSKVDEKTIVLSIAKKFGKLIADNYPDVTVIYTRANDADISLAERAHIANRNKADLFISIHANSHPTTAPTGVETFVMGLSESRANLAVAQKENADILLEEDYKSNAAYKDFDPNSPESYVMLTMYQNAYLDKSLNFAQTIQNQYRQNLRTVNRGVKQAELFVLYKTTCPSVLTEVGFISNPTEEAFMMSDEGQARIAISLFNAFMNYKATEEGTGKIANPKFYIPGVPEELFPVVQDIAEEKKVEASEPVEKTEVSETPEVAAEAPAPVEATRPVPTTRLVTPPATPVATETPETPKTQQPPVTREAPATQEPPTTRPAPPTLFYTVQFLCTSNELPVWAPEFKGLSDILVARNGQLYCYSVGRFATFNEANEYCRKLQKETSYKDAWPLRRTADRVWNLGEPPKPLPNQSQPAPAPRTAPATPATTVTPATPANSAPQTGVSYRVQFSTSRTVFQVGAPEMHGIQDFQYAKSGNYYVYTCGDYQTLAEARKRCEAVKSTTPFKDAFVICIKNGKRVSIE